MPSMANITVKKADGTTDIVYDAISPSGGNGVDAVWRQDTGAAAGLPVGMRALLKARSNWNGPKTARRCQINYKRPYATQDSTTTRYSTTDSVVIDTSAIIPEGMPANEISEAVYQACNLLASTLIKQSLAAGYMPT